MKQMTIQCSSCKGTGIYKGFAEKGGAGVICHVCKGKGHTEFRYEEFGGLVERKDIVRVYDGSYGYAITDIDITTDDGKMIRFSDGGCTYTEWLAGAKPKPIKDLYCPYLHNNTGIGNEPLERCRQGCGYGRISDCKFYADKATCWDLLEGEERNATLQ